MTTNPQLGKLISEHPTLRGATIAWSAVSAVSLFLGLGLMTLMSDGFHPHNLRSFKSVNEQWIVSLVIGGIFVVLGLALAVWIGTSMSVCVRMYEQGLSRTALGKTKNMRWDELERFWRSLLVVNGRDVIRYAAENHAGLRFSFSQRLRNVQDIGQRIGQELFKHKFEPTRSAFNSGDTLFFGVLTLTNTTLKYKSRAIVLSHIEVMRSTSAFLTIWKKGGRFTWARIPNRSIANLDILFALLEGHVRVTH